MITPITLPAPASGEMSKVDEGIYWLRMPLPFELDHINLYLLESGDGYYIIDTGIQSNLAKNVWQKIIAELDKPIAGLIVTHMHPDHVGLAGWLCKTYQLPLYMSALEYFTCIATFSSSPEADTSVEVDYYVQAGMEKSKAEAIVKDRDRFNKTISPLPLAFKRLQHGDSLTIGNDEWQVLTYAGHSPEHVCLFNLKRNILIGGDQVLPYISPNIGVYSRIPDANPLKDYLESLVCLAELPEDTLVLPSHNVPYSGLRTRCAELQHHHQQQLEKLLSHCQTSQTVVNCLPALYERKLSSGNLFFALAECHAHLNYLMYNQQTSRTSGDDGVFRFKLRTSF